MKFQVYIEGCRDNTPEASRNLSQAIASRFGVAAEQIASRLKKGRFRIKTDMSMPEAESFVAYLESEGALCSIIDSDGIVVTPASSAGEAPGMLPLASSQSPAERPHKEPPSPQTRGFGAMQLSTLDGVNSSGESAESALREDAFLPPDMVQEEGKLEIEMPTRRQSAAQRAMSVTNTEALAGAKEGSQRSEAAQEEPDSPDKKEGALEFLANRMRPRFALGVAFSLLLGFGIMTPIASSREASRYEQPLADLITDYQDADSLLAWDSLDAQVSETIASLESRRMSVVIISLLIWLAASGLLAFLWFRVLQWSRWESAH